MSGKKAVIQNVIGHSNPAMTAHYTHVNKEAARQVAGVLTLGDAAADPKREPLPGWAVVAAKKLNSKNWKQIKAELLANQTD